MGWEIIEDEAGGLTLPPEEKAGMMVKDMQQGQGGYQYSPFVAFAEGFNRPIDRLAQGILNPVMSGSQKWEQMKQRTSDDFNLASQQHPGATFGGQLAGGVAMSIPTTMGGSMAAASALGAARGVPYVGKAAELINSLIGAQKTSKLAKYGVGALGGGTLGAAEGALMLPESGETRMGNAAMGAGLGAGLGVAIPSIGDLLGGGVNLFKRHVLGNKDIALRDIMAKMTPNELSTLFQNVKKARSLGTTLSPAEASGSPLLKKFEEQLSGDDELAKRFAEWSGNQKLSQKEAIENFFEELNPTGQSKNRDFVEQANEVIDLKKKARADKAQPYYDKADKVRIGPEKLNKLLNDPVIKNAYDDFFNNENYSNFRRFKGKDSIEILQKVKETLDDKISSLRSSGKNHEAEQVRASKNKMLEQLDKLSPDYKKARSIYTKDSPDIDRAIEGELGQIAGLKDRSNQRVGQIIFDPKETDIGKLRNIRDEFLKPGEDFPQRLETWLGMVAEEMGKKLDTKQLFQQGNFGTGFFKDVFGNEKTFQQFYEALSRAPNSQVKLKAMRDVWKNLIDERSIKTSKLELGEGKGFIANTIDLIGGGLKGITGDQYGKAVIDIITNPKYDAMMRDALKNTNKKGVEKRIAEIVSYAIDQQGGVNALTTVGTSFATE